MSKQKRDHRRKRRKQYIERNDNLKALGFNSYDQYLRSELWKGIRDRMLAKHPRCYVCRRKASQVHHGAYRKVDLDGSTDRQLFSVCARCHRHLEFRKSDGHKLPPEYATNKMHTMARGRYEKSLPPVEIREADTLTLAEMPHF